MPRPHIDQRVVAERLEHGRCKRIEACQLPVEPGQTLFGQGFATRLHQVEGCLRRYRVGAGELEQIVLQSIGRREWRRVDDRIGGVAATRQTPQKNIPVLGFLGKSLADQHSDVVVEVTVCRRRGHVFICRIDIVKLLDTPSEDDLGAGLAAQECPPERVGLDLLRPESALSSQSQAQVASAFAFNLGQIEYDFVLPQGLDQCRDETRVASGGGRKVFNRAPTVETVRQSTQQAPGRPVDLQHTLIRLDDRRHWP